MNICDMKCLCSECTRALGYLPGITQVLPDPSPRQDPRFWIRLTTASAAANVYNAWHMDTLGAGSACRLHPLTKHRVFTGPGFSFAVRLGDSASGGQVVMSHEAWLQIQAIMPAAGFPVLRQLGMFQEEHGSPPFWVYEVRADPPLCTGM